MVAMHSTSEKQFLLKLARSAIEHELNHQTLSLPKPLSLWMKEKRGVFVTLHKNGDLRGCIGTIMPVYQVCEAVAHHALDAAFSDPRFPQLRKQELSSVKIEVSVLTEPQRLSFHSPTELLKSLVPGKHGVVLECHGRSATFLPQVWEDLPNKEDFLNHLCLKVGLPQDAWQSKGIEVSVYEVQKFEE